MLEPSSAHSVMAVVISNVSAGTCRGGSNVRGRKTSQEREACDGREKKSRDRKRGWEWRGWGFMVRASERGKERKREGAYDGEGSADGRRERFGAVGRHGRRFREFHLRECVRKRARVFPRMGEYVGAAWAVC